MRFSPTRGLDRCRLGSPCSSFHRAAEVSNQILCSISFFYVRAAVDPVFQMSSYRNTKWAANLVATDFFKQTLQKHKYRVEHFGKHMKSLGLGEEGQCWHLPVAGWGGGRSTWPGYTMVRLYLHPDSLWILGCEFSKDSTTFCRFLYFLKFVLECNWSAMLC